MIKYYKRDGTPYTGKNAYLKWAKDFDKKDRILKQETLSNGLFISTVFLGLNYNYGKGKPLIFETMVFDRSKKSSGMGDLDQKRWTTEEEAYAGHYLMVEKWRKYGKIQVFQLIINILQTIFVILFGPLLMAYAYWNKNIKKEVK